jgi:heavy metal sensor kinase
MTRWSHASIRLRLTGSYVIALAALLLVYATATFLAVRHEFYEQFDAQLHDDFERAEGALTVQPDGRITWSADAHREPDAEPRGAEVWSASGDLLFRVDGSPVLPPAVPRAAGEDRYGTVQSSGSRWRTLAAFTMVGGRSVVLRVARSEEHLRMQLWEILVVLVLGFPLIVGLAGVGGYVLARRALAPIDHLAAEARRITADRLHERLSVPNAHDEIGRLASVINETFHRLEASFDQLRRFTADASHELRTPLAVIRGTGEMALSGAHTTAECKDALGSMLEEADRLTNLVETLLRLSHGDTGTVRLTPESVDLGQLARDAVASVAILAEERHQRLHLDVASDTVVTADRLVLREALTNVIDNAIKYSPTESTVTIRVESDGRQAVCTIADEGPGIPPQYRERVFDRFFRMDEARSRDDGGTGLGLAIAKWAVDVNGGSISVSDAPTHGAVFRISLPATSKASTATVREPTTPARRT